MQGSGPQGRIVAEDVEKFLKEGGSKAKPAAEAKKAQADKGSAAAAPSRAAKKDKEAARSGGFDEQQVSALRAVSAQLSSSIQSSFTSARKMPVE